MIGSDGKYDTLDHVSPETWRQSGSGILSYLLFIFNTVFFYEVIMVR